MVEEVRQFNYTMNSLSLSLFTAPVGVAVAEVAIARVLLLGKLAPTRGTVAAEAILRLGYKLLA